MLKAVTRVLKNEKYCTLFLLLLFVFNSAVIYKVAAAKYTGSAGANNIFSITDKTLCPLKTTCLSGVAGNGINQMLNTGVVSGASYSAIVSACKDAGKECKSLADLAYVNSIYPPNFNTLDAVASANATLLEQRPASGVDYFQDKVYALTHFNSVSAQTIASREAYYSPGGTGFTLLKPIQNFWSWSVRVVYGFLLLIVIIIAFAIMFRQRLSGNVEVTVQNAIPAIALAMILVPLSYAISGLFIDVITVGTNAVHEFLIGAQGSPGNSLYLNSASNIYNDPLNGQAYPDRGYYPDDIRVDWLRARDNLNVAPAFSNVAGNIGEVTGLNGNVIFLGIGSIVNLLTGKTSDDPAQFAWVGDLIQFFVSIVTIWISVQVFVALFKKYLVLILYPVISPFIFATVAIPGNGTKSIMQYAKVLLAAALAYIVTYAMFLLSIIFTSREFVQDVPTFASASFNPPLIGLRAIGIGDNELTQLLLTLIGLGIYFSIPSTLKSIDKALGADGALPKFLTTPIDSFRESQRVMFKTAPAFAGRAVGTAAGLAGNAGAAPFRAYTGARDILDRARGIDPEKDYRSYRNRQRAARQSQADNAEVRRQRSQQSGNILTKMSGNARAAIDNASNNLAGQIAGTGTKLPSDVQRPKVDVTGNDITINRQDVAARIREVGVTFGYGNIKYAAYNAMAPRPIVVLASGTLEIKVSGPSVVLPYPPTIDFGSVKEKSVGRPDIMVFDKKLDKAALDTALTKIKYKSASDQDQYIANPDILRVELVGKPKAAGTDTLKQDFRIVSNDLEKLFQTENGGNNVSNFTPSATNAIMRPGVQFKLDKDLALKIGGKDDFTSGPFNIKFKLS